MDQQKQTPLNPELPNNEFLNDFHQRTTDLGNQIIPELERMALRKSNTAIDFYTACIKASCNTFGMWCVLQTLEETKAPPSDDAMRSFIEIMRLSAMTNFQGGVEQAHAFITKQGAKKEPSIAVPEEKRLILPEHMNGRPR